LGFRGCASEPTEEVRVSRWRFQRGDVPIGCLVGLLVLLAAVLIGIKAVPAITTVGELEKRVTELADRANRREYTDKRILRDILAKAEELDLPVAKENVRIDRTEHRIKVRINFDYPLEFPFYTYVWHKEIYEDRPLF
jgi:hypothetical protein